MAHYKYLDRDASFIQVPRLLLRWAHHAKNSSAIMKRPNEIIIVTSISFHQILMIFRKLQSTVLVQNQIARNVQFFNLHSLIKFCVRLYSKIKIQLLAIECYMHDLKKKKSFIIIYLIMLTYPTHIEKNNCLSTLPVK